MSKKRTNLYRASILTLTIIGIISIILSIIYASSLLAILGVCFIFWNIILIYITPTKQVPIDLFRASNEINEENIERILNDYELTQKAVYLPPNMLGNIEYSVAFIPKHLNVSIPNAKLINNRLKLKNELGILITPPGVALAKLIEEQLGHSFIQMDIQEFSKVIPDCLVEILELAKNVEINFDEKQFIIKLETALLNSLCRSCETQVHELVGCLVSGAFACALAKVIGEPIIIKEESHNSETDTIIITLEIRAV